MFYQVGLLPVTNNLLDISSDIYLIVQGMIRSDRLIIPDSCVNIPSEVIFKKVSCPVPKE